MISPEVKMTFIHRAVKAYVDEVVVAMAKTINKNSVIKTGALRSSLGNTSNENVGKLMFKEYGRFVDMGVGQGRKLSDIYNAGTKQGGAAKKLRKKRRIYSPIAYGKLNGLMADIMYGLTDEVVLAIKTELEQANPIKP